MGKKQGQMADRRALENGRRVQRFNRKSGSFSWKLPGNFYAVIFMQPGNFYSPGNFDHELPAGIFAESLLRRYFARRGQGHQLGAVAARNFLALHPRVIVGQGHGFRQLDAAGGRKDKVSQTINKITAKKLLSRPSHRKRTQRRRASGSDWVWCIYRSNPGPPVSISLNCVFPSLSNRKIPPIPFL